MRKRNWQEYNKQLVQRGSITFFLDPKLFKSIKNPIAKYSKGRPMEFHDKLIEFLLMVKIQYRLPYRALEGFSKDAFKKLGHMPTFSLTCKRAKVLGMRLPKLSRTRPEVVLIDASGIKVLGEGEWKVKIHGKGRPRKWLKIHLAVDPKTQQIVAELLTEPFVADCVVTSPLLNQVPKGVKIVIGDGAYDKRQAREAIKQKGATPLVIPPRNAKYRGLEDERDRAVLDIKMFGGDELARSIWRKISGYSRRSLVETTFSRYKRCFGDRFYSKTTDRQIVENRIKCNMLNRMMRSAV